MMAIMMIGMVSTTIKTTMTILTTMVATFRMMMMMTVTTTMTMTTMMLAIMTTMMMVTMMATMMITLTIMMMRKVMTIMMMRMVMMMIRPYLTFSLWHKQRSWVLHLLPGLYPWRYLLLHTSVHAGLPMRTQTTVRHSLDTNIYRMFMSCRLYNTFTDQCLFITWHSLISRFVHPFYFCFLSDQGDL